MQDQQTLTPGQPSGPYTTDKIGSVHVPVHKLMVGAWDENGQPVSSSNPMPVTLPATAATAAHQVAGNASATATATALGAPADAAASSDTGTFSLVALFKRALSNWTTLLARLPALVSGRIPVDGSGVTQPVSGSVTVSGTVTATGPLTDAQLRASALPLAATAATLAAQTTGNASLALIEARTVRTAAGTSAADALPVQGVTGGVPQRVSLPAIAARSTTSVAANAVGGAWVAFPSGAAQFVEVYATELAGGAPVAVRVRYGGSGTGIRIPAGGSTMLSVAANSSELQVLSDAAAVTVSAVVLA